MTPEEYIKEYTKFCSNHTCYEEDEAYFPWLTPEQALKAVELARNEIFNKTIEWLTGNFRMPDGWDVAFYKAVYKTVTK